MASEIIILKKKTSLPCRQVIHERVHLPLTVEIQIHHAEIRSEPHISQITRKIPDTKLQYGCSPSVHPTFGFQQQELLTHLIRLQAGTTLHQFCAQFTTY